MSSLICTKAVVQEITGQRALCCLKNTMKGAVFMKKIYLKQYFFL